MFKNILNKIVYYFCIGYLIFWFIFIMFNAIKAHDRKCDESIKNSYNKGYIDACKDFHNGKLKADLVELPGGEKQWQFINKKK